MPGISRHCLNLVNTQPLCNTHTHTHTLPLLQVLIFNLPSAKKAGFLSQGLKIVKHKTWATTIVSGFVWFKLGGSMNMKSQMKPTFSVISMAFQAGENSQSNTQNILSYSYLVFNPEERRTAL